MATLDDVVREQKKTNRILTVMLLADFAILGVAGAYVLSQLRP